VSFRTYKHQNLWNSLVINPILSSVFWINGFYVVFWRLNLGVKDPQQAPPHLLFARPRAKVDATMKHDFERYDASIKVIPCLEPLKSGMTLTPSHHYPTMKHTWSFCNFWNRKRGAYFSSNGTLKSLNGAYILTKGFWNCLFFHPTCKKVYVELWVGMNRETYLHHIILLSQKPDPRRCKSYTLIKKCKCVKIKLFLV
jgi:hypothetical protein